MQTHGSFLDIFRVSYHNSFASGLGGACAMKTITMALIQTCQIQAIITLPQRLSVSAQLTNCTVGQCWQVMAHIGACWDHRFSCSIKFFHSKIALGRALCESWGVACATTEKHWCPVSTYACFPGKAFLGKPAKITFVENKDVNSWIIFRYF